MPKQTKQIDIKKVLQKLVNSESNDGCDKGLTVVEKKWVDKISIYLDSARKTEMEAKRQNELYDLRELAAERAWSRSPLNGLEVNDADGWETDGPDRWLRKFYYEIAGKDSGKAGFIVEFKKDSDFIKDEHVNIW